MKTLRLLFVSIAMIAGLSSFSQNTISQELVNVSITGETTREDLMYLRNDLKAVGVNFEYNPRFDNSRKILGIEFTVNGEGFTSTYNLEQFAPEQAINVNIVRQAGVDPVVQINTIQKKK